VWQLAHAPKTAARWAAALLMLLHASAVGAALKCAAGEDTTMCAALADLYNAMSGAAWTNNEGWSTAAAGVATSYCTFTGLTCDGTGALTELCAVIFVCDTLVLQVSRRLMRRVSLVAGWLEDNALRGTLPNTLGDLTTLRILCVKPVS
jgi:hypothetical protein